MHLLNRKIRAAAAHPMSLADWIAHGWYMVTSSRYRASVRVLRQAFEMPDDPYLIEATKELRHGTRFDNDGAVDFTRREGK